MILPTVGLMSLVAYGQFIFNITTVPLKWTNRSLN